MWHGELRVPNCPVQLQNGEIQVIGKIAMLEGSSARNSRLKLDWFLDRNRVLTSRSSHLQRRGSVYVKMAWGWMVNSACKGAGD